MALPYVAVLAAMTLLISPYLRKEKNTVDVYEQRWLYISTQGILVFAAYLIYIIFAVSKSFMPGKGAKDAYAYYVNFTGADCTLKHFMTEVSTFEPGYSFAVWIVRQLTSEYRFMLWIWHTLTFILIVGFYKKVYLKTNYLFPVFIGLMILMSQFNTLRMSISISIALFSLFAMYKKSWIKAGIIILCAASFHVSAVIMFPVFMVVFIVSHWNGYKKSLLFTLICLGIILTIAMFGIINRLALGTDKSVYVGESSVAWGMDLAIIVFSMLGLVKMKQLKQLSKFNEILILALPVGIICIPLQLNISVMYRMLLFFHPIMLALIPSIIKCYKESSTKVVSYMVSLLSYGYLITQINSFCTESVEVLGKYATFT